MPLLQVIHIQQLFPSLPHHHTAAGTVPVVPFGGREADHTEVPEVGDVEVAILATSNQRADQPGCHRRFRVSAKQKARQAHAQILHQNTAYI